MEGHGREAFDEELSLSRTIGWFTSIYPLVLENLDKDIRKVIRNTKEELRRIPMKGAGYPVIYGIETEYLPLITFNYLGDMASGSKQAMLHQTMTMPVADFIAPENHYGTDININSLISDDHLTLHVELNKSQFAPAICRRFINHLETSMKQVISHCYEVKIPENTASDFGELEWNDDEFLRIEHDYQARNEHIQKIEPVSKEMEDKLIHFMRRIDMPSCATETIFEIDRSIPHDVAEAAVAEMNQRFSFVRKKVVRTGVSSCKVITTDHGTALHYCEDYLEHEDRIWTSIEQLKTKMRQISLDLQHESSLQIALLNCSAKRSYLIICGNGIFTNDSQMRACLSLLFRQLAAPLHDPANLMEWAEILCIADELRQQKEAAKADTVCLPEDPEDNPSTAYEPIHMYCEVPSQKSVFFVHTANTGSKAYYLFAKKLKERCTFGVFEQYNLFHPHQLLTSIEAIATKYIHVLQEKQPHGPYHLGGWCYGGTVAYEMAQQLKLAGETVASLTLFDSHIIADTALRKKILEDTATQSREYLSTSPLFEDLRNQGMLETLIANSFNSISSWLNYVPKPYDGSICYFTAEKLEQGLRDTQLAMYRYTLRKQAGGFECLVEPSHLKIIPVETDHDSMMNEASLTTIMPEFIKLL